MPIPKSGETFDDALEGFRAAAEEIKRADFARNGYKFAVPAVYIKKGGRRYAKLISTENDPQTGERRAYSESVHSFVEIATGEIFKPASCKAPARVARGSIYCNNGRDSMTATGSIYYLR